MTNNNLAREVQGTKNPNYKDGNRMSGIYPCPVCGTDRKCEKRNAWRKCWRCHTERPSTFSRKEWHKKTKHETKRWAMEYLGGKCSMCGNADLPQCCYQFHHLDGNTKKDNPSHLMRQKPTEKLKNELDKCVLLCANCHAITHWDDSATDLTSLSYS